jgi:hypothetical protein
MTSSQSIRFFALAILVAFTQMTALVSAEAAIPQRSTIASRVARTHGRGSYIIEQDLAIRTSGEPIMLRERWYIESGERMRLSVRTSSAAAKANEAPLFEAVYRDGKKTFSDLDSGSTKNSSLSAEFSEGLFHARTGKSFLFMLASLRILPTSALKDQPRPTKIEQISRLPESQIRLGREGGSVAWIFGDPSPTEGKSSPQAWIEQDGFHLRKIRFVTEADVSAAKITAYANGLQLPRERTVTWENGSAIIRVVTVQSVAPAQIQKLLDPNSLLSSPKAAPSAPLPIVREFYSRFR